MYFDRAVVVVAAAGDDDSWADAFFVDCVAVDSMAAGVAADAVASVDAVGSAT